MSLVGRNDSETAGNELAAQLDGLRASGLRAYEPAGRLVVSETLPAHQNHFVGIIALSNIIFNLTDLATALTADGGLGGANLLLPMIPTAFLPTSLASLMVMKSILVVSAVVVARIGSTTTNSYVRRLVLGYLVVSTSGFYLESMRNALLITA